MSMAPTNCSFSLVYGFLDELFLLSSPWFALHSSIATEGYGGIQKKEFDMLQQQGVKFGLFLRFGGPYTRTSKKGDL